MDLSIPLTADALFEVTGRQSEQMGVLANQSLSNGIEKYIRKDFKGAVLDFKRAFGLAPYSDYAVDAVKYLALSHQGLGQNAKAIQAYRQGLDIHPDRDDLQLALGNLLFAEGRIAEAVKAYETAVRLYDDDNNRFALGQGYLKAGNHDDAARQFQKIIQRSPSSPNGHFGLGQTFAARRLYSDAIDHFERAVQKDREFYAGYAELGYAYADKGDLGKAEEIRDFLENKNKTWSETLAGYIRKKTPPKIMFALTAGTFPHYFPPKTRVAALNDYLNTANAGRSFTVLFQFNKPMDRDSIENPGNWTICRSIGNGPGTQYNFGLPVPATESRIAPFPDSVFYDENNQTALVRFTLHQNDTADATIDPSRIEFSFRGIDADGNAMHPKYDQFTGFSGSF
jgi:Tfp pilus assembly protein PilF